MSREQTQAVVDRFLNYDYSVLADDAVGEIIGLGIQGTGPAAIEQVSNRLYHEMFDADPELRQVVIGDTNGVVELDFVGTHKGTFYGVPPTGKRINVPALAIYDVDGETMTGVRLYFPVNIVLEQLGRE